MMRHEFLPFSPPLIGEEEIHEVVDTLQSGWITTGPKTKQFENNFKEYLGAPAALALSSGTAAMHAALVASGIGPGDEVITTPLTFCSTVHVIEQVGAKPVLADVEPDTLNIDPEQVAAVVTSRTRAILPVHYGGHPANLERLLEIAIKHELIILEDAAHALPAKYKGTFIGSNDNPVAFSFYATKNLTTGEGGMLTGPPDFIKKAEIISLHGMNRDAWKRYHVGGNWYYEVISPGFKYNMTDIQASIGIWQLRKLDRFQERRQRIVAIYNNAFNENESLILPTARPEVKHAWHLYPIRLDNQTLRIDRDRFAQEMTSRKIGISVHFIPIHIHPYFRKKYGYNENDFPVAYKNYLRLITLPLNLQLTDRDVYDVVDAVTDITKKFRR